jgi:hypothetical protein
VAGIPLSQVALRLRPEDDVIVAKAPIKAGTELLVDRASVTVLSELYAGTDEVGIKVTARYDTAALNPKAVVKLSGITA